MHEKNCNSVVMMPVIEEGRKQFAETNSIHPMAQGALPCD